MSKIRVTVIIEFPIQPGYYPKGISEDQVLEIEKDNIENEGLEMYLDKVESYEVELISE